MTHEITTPRLILRPFDLNDVFVTQLLAAGHLVTANAASNLHPNAPDAAADWIAAHAEKMVSEQEWAYAITRRTTGEIMGAVSLLMDPAHRHRGELGYWISQPYWNSGYATEAVAALLAMAEARFKLQVVTARCMANNQASCRVLEKNGFKPTAFLAKHLEKWGKLEDVVEWELPLTETTVA